jgi:hypothetical protein
MKPCLFEEEILDPIVFVQALEGQESQFAEGLIQDNPDKEEEKGVLKKKDLRVFKGVLLDVEKDKQTVFM